MFNANLKTTILSTLATASLLLPIIATSQPAIANPVVESGTAQFWGTDAPPADGKGIVHGGTR